MSRPERILVCGGRDFTDQQLVVNILNELRPYFAEQFCLIHGGARGADRCAHVWAFFQGCPVIEMKANWDFYDKKAGPVRNTWMLNWAEPDLIIAFPGGVGTANMVLQAQSRGIDIYEPI